MGWEEQWMARLGKQARARTKSKIKKTNRTTRRARMTDAEKTVTGAEQPPEVDISKRDLSGCGIVTIRGTGVPNVLEIYIRNPTLAAVVRSMPAGNFYRDKYDPIYAPVLRGVGGDAKSAMVLTYPGIYPASKLFEKGTDFDFMKPPRGILIMNPDRLAEGFALTVELKTPVPRASLRKWGEQVKDGMNDIIAASRPFKMEWISVAKEGPVARTFPPAPASVQADVGFTEEGGGEVEGEGAPF